MNKPTNNERLFICNKISECQAQHCEKHGEPHPIDWKCWNKHCYNYPDICCIPLDKLPLYTPMICMYAKICKHDICYHIIPHTHFGKDCLYAIGCFSNELTKMQKENSHCVKFKQSAMDNQTE
jgi:hypothetical protein